MNYPHGCLGVVVFTKKFGDHKLSFMGFSAISLKIWSYMVIRNCLQNGNNTFVMVPVIIQEKRGKFKR